MQGIVRPEDRDKKFFRQICIKLYSCSPVIPETSSPLKNDKGTYLLTLEVTQSTCYFSTKDLSTLLHFFSFPDPTPSELFKYLSKFWLKNYRDRYYQKCQGLCKKPGYGSKIKDPCNGGYGTKQKKTFDKLHSSCTYKQHQYPVDNERYYKYIYKVLPSE